MIKMESKQHTIMWSGFRVDLLKWRWLIKIRCCIPGMKQWVQLWKIWGLFILEEERNNVCPQPPDDLIKAVAEEKAPKQAMKKRARSSANNNGDNIIHNNKKPKQWSIPGLFQCCGAPTQQSAIGLVLIIFFKLQV
jgi:hypothetical protein